MKKNLRFEKGENRSSFMQLLSLTAIMFLAAFSSVKAQIASHAVDLNPETAKVTKQDFNVPGLKSANIQNYWFSQLSTSNGTWTTVAVTAPHQNAGVCLLFSDGRVFCYSIVGTIGDICDIRAPDIHSSYLNGTWSQSAESQNLRFAFASDILKDGRLYVAGGEYVAGLIRGEVYNPLTNIWTLTPDPRQKISNSNASRPGLLQLSKGYESGG